MDDIRRLCKQRIELLTAQMAELEAAAKRAAMQRNTLATEMRQIEGVLAATKATEPAHEIVTGGTKERHKC